MNFLTKISKMKKTLILLSLFAMSLSANAQFGKLLKQADKAKEKVMNKADELTGGSALSNADVGNGLKEALDKGVDEAVQFLSAEDGYYGSPYKILLPEDAQKVVKKLAVIPGWDGVERKLEEKMNRAAELAAAKAKPIFVNAIKSMTFQDAMNILMGEPDAATTYLNRTTNKALFAEFMPVIQTSLDEVNARDYWRKAVGAYNKIPLTKKANPELDAHVTQMALKGMFSLVEKKELDIRENVGSRSSDLLKKVFAKQDK